MRVLLVCRECGHQENGRSEESLMNKIKLWNHVRKYHPFVEPSRLHLVMRITTPERRGVSSWN